MHVLVIGGSRFVGYLTTWRLLFAGHRVTLLNRGTLGDPFGDRVERLRGDRTRDLAALIGRRQFDAAIDFAAYHGTDVAGALAALDGRVGHYVLISTGQVYLVRDGAAARPDGFREDDYDGPVMPRPAAAADASEWDYGAGKRECEDVLAEAVARGFPATAIRLPMVHGERDYYRRLEGYLWRLYDGAPLLVPAADRRTRHVYGASVARGLVELIARPATGRAYNWAQAEAPTLRELLALLADAVGARLEIVEPSDEALADAGLVRREVSPLSGRWMSFVDPSRAVAELGFQHEAVASYLGRIVASFLASPPASPPPGYANRAREVALARGG